MNDPTAAPDNTPAAWRQSKWLALAEFALVALIFFADERHFIPVSKTPFLLMLGWISLRLRGLRWRDVGLTKNRSWKLTLALGIAAGLLMETFELFVSQPLLTRLTGKQPDLSDFQDLPGNFKLAALGFLFIWTLAAFGEEMVWRGYLMNRVADLGKRTRLAWFVSLIVVNMGFGYAHSYQGITGIIDEGLMGVLLGLMFLGTGCNLWVPIVAHGVQDTVDLLLIYFSMYPGLHR
ncbi:MAG: CPBP family intramembrane metalloprotease [Acidobacteriia bacterium]|nr:CPBP family intramembrane metalloprotease [Terriglobia bacterium]